MKREGQLIDPDKVSRLTEATDWLLRLENPARTEGEYTEWLRWCDAHPDNLTAFETVQNKWQVLDVLRSDPEFNRLAPAATAPLNRSRRTAWAAAAAIGALVLAFTAYRYYWIPEAPTQKVAADLTNRAATLPDGSRMILGTQSRVNVDFNGPQRRLDLSSGEAYFKVRHDKARPFVVHAGEVSVTAVGTAFDVRRRNDQVTVTVEEGVVEVTSSGDGPWRAEAGYQLTYSTRQRTASIASVDPAVELSWRNGDLTYLYEPLGSVIEDLNRYSSRRIVIADPQVAKIPFTGTAFVNSLDNWLAGIEQAYPVDVQRTGNGDIVLRSRY